MFKRFGSKKDVSANEYKCTIRLLDDTEVLQCDFTVIQQRLAHSHIDSIANCGSIMFPLLFGADAARTQGPILARLLLQESKSARKGLLWPALRGLDETESELREQSRAMITA